MVLYIWLFHINYNAFKKIKDNTFLFKLGFQELIWETVGKKYGSIALKLRLYDENF